MPLEKTASAQLSPYLDTITIQTGTRHPNTDHRKSLELELPILVNYFLQNISLVFDYVKVEKNVIKYNLSRI